MKSDIIASIIYNLYLKSLRFQRKSIKIKKLCRKVWGKSLKKFADRTITTKIHGSTVFINYGYSYPIICREFSTYNNPLVELSYQTYLIKGSSITIVDIGSAIGDTVLLLEKSLPGMVEEYYCVEGDKEFSNFLTENLSFLTHKRIIESFISSSIGKAKSLVKIHPGTASAQGRNEIVTTTLDQLVESDSIGHFDLLKIDVDGYDGLVLLGSIKTLIRFRPTIIFEWHPIICVDTGNNHVDHFKALDECGYDRFIFFDNYGNFSHFMTHIDYQAIDLMASILIDNDHKHAVYFDVIAIHCSSEINIKQLAGLKYSTKHKDRY